MFSRWSTASRRRSARDRAPALVFVHVPKCGGTTIHDWLAAELPPGRLSPERNRLPLEPAPERVEALRQHAVFSGHFDVLDLRVMPRPRLVFTVLRDPIDRIVSIYDYWRAHEPEHVERHDLIGPRLAQEMTFDEFAALPDRRIAPDLENSYVRTFTGLIRTSDPIPDPERALAEATDVVAAFDHVGRLTDLDETIRWVADRLGISVPGHGVERHNVRGEWDEPHLRNVPKTVPSAAAIDALEPLVDLDRRLLDHFTRTR